MKKRILALLCVLAMICAMLPMSVFAAELDETAELAEDFELAEDESISVKSGLEEASLAEAEPFVNLAVTARDADGNAKALDELRSGDVLTAVVTVDECDLCGAQVKLSFDTSKFEVTDITNDLVDAESGVAGWTQKSVSEVEEANANGIVVATGVYVNDEEDPANLTLDSALDIVTITFVVKAGVEGDAEPFSLLQEDGDDTVLTYFSDGFATSYDNVSFAPEVSTEIVSVIALTNVELTGALTTPAKDADDASAFTGENVTAVVTWAPELLDGKFAASTVYTATVTVTANDGYEFADGAVVTGGELNFEETEGTYVATKQFEATAADATPLTGAVITLSGALTYTGSEQTQGVTVSLNEVALKEGVDFEVTDNAATYAGEYELTVSGIGAYTGTENKTWTIAAAEQTLSAVEENLEIGRGATLSAEQLAANVSGAEGELTFTGSNEAGSVTANVFTATQTAGEVAISVAAAAVDVNKDGEIDIEAAESTELFTITVRDEDPIDTGACGANVTYEYYPSGKLVIKGTGAMANYSGTDMPWNAYKTSITSLEVKSGVTVLGKNAFYRMTNLASVSLGDTVTTIANTAFQNCSGLTAIVLPESLTTIQSSAFKGCSKLATVTLSCNCTSIAGTAFGSTGLTKVIVNGSEARFTKYVLPGVSATGNDLFLSATKEYTIANSGVCGANGDNVIWEFDANTKTLLLDGTGAMAAYPGGPKDAPWYSLKANIVNVVFTDGITNVGSNAFSGFTKLANVTLPESLLTIESYAFQKTALKEVVLPGKVTSIKMRAFDNCASLSTVTIPFSVNTIEKNAFVNCNALAKVYYTGTATKWARMTIEATGNDKLLALSPFVEQSASELGSGTIGTISWRVDSDDVLWIEGEGEIPNFAVGKAPWFSFRGSVVALEIGENITRIGSYAFCKFANVKSVSIPASVSEIGLQAFFMCSSLVSVELNEGLESIKEGAFRKCTSLTTVTIPDSVTKIGSEAFQTCSSLVSVSIPDSITLIDMRTFAECSSLVSVKLSKNVKTIGLSAFNGCNKIASVSYARPQVVFNAIEFRANNASLINAATSFPQTESGKFTEGITWTLQGTTLTVNGTGAMPDYTVSEQYSWDTRYKKIVKSIVISEGITHVGDAAFVGFAGVTSLSLPSTLKSIGAASFREMRNLANVTIPSGCTTIGANAFRACTHIRYVTLPTSVVSIGGHAFENCSLLVTVNYAGTQESFDKIEIGSNNEPLTNADLVLG